MLATSPVVFCEVLQGFDTQNLHSEEAVDIALGRLNTSLTSGTLNQKTFLEEALQQGYRLEFILSGTSHFYFVLKLVNSCVP